MACVHHARGITCWWPLDAPKPISIISLGPRDRTRHSRGPRGVMLVHLAARPRSIHVKGYYYYYILVNVHIIIRTNTRVYDGDVSTEKVSTTTTTVGIKLCVLAKKFNNNRCTRRWSECACVCVRAYSAAWPIPKRIIVFLQRGVGFWLDVIRHYIIHYNITISAALDILRVC